MPGYDGTGPKGRGPMTGRGSGHCMLKIPRTQGEPQTGFAGLSGRPVTLLPDSPRVDIASLHLRAWQVQIALGAIDRRIAILEAIRQGIGDSRNNAEGGDPTRCLDGAIL